MGKVILLAGSNFRKNRGTSIGLFLLMTIAACLIGIVLLVIMDAYPLAGREAERLNAGDGYFRIDGDIDGIDADYVNDLIGEDVSDFVIYRSLAFNTANVPFGDGKTACNILVDNKDAFSRTVDRTEIITEDTSISGAYLYLPYQFYTSGGYNIGDTYSFTLGGADYDLSVRGFINVTYYGCNNNGEYKFIFDDKSFDAIWDRESAEHETVVINYALKENVNAGSFKIRTGNEILKKSPGANVTSQLLSEVLFNKTFMALIIAISFLIVTVILVLVVTLMLANSISGYIRENMKTVGALKAIGYTGKDIRASLYIWFAGLAVIGGVLGSTMSYLVMPVVAPIITGQMGLPYNVSFSALASIVPVVFIIGFALLVTCLSSGRIGKIQPIIALREGMESHNFRKNRVPLDRTSLSLNMSLAAKTFFMNMKQNVITFIVTGFLVFACVIGLLMYENFNRNLKVEILTFETTAGTVSVSRDMADDVRTYLEDRDDVENIREIMNLYFNYNDEDKLIVYLIDDADKLNNKSICYKGRMPVYDNEIMISGKFASNYGFDVGDEITLDYGDSSFTYLISGLMQSCNNGGKESTITFDGAKHMTDTSVLPAWYWFDLANEGDDNAAYTNIVLDDVKEKFGDDNVSVLNFYETIDGAATTFKSIAVMMLALMIVISFIIIVLVFWLLVKALIYSKRKDYGIYKALGYTSGNLMLQTAASFMPSVILSVVVFSIISYFAANPYMQTIMGIFGLMKCDFDIPVVGVVMIGAAFTVFAFISAMWQSGRIRNIECYDMLIGE